jgi:hypothetical protein
VETLVTCGVILAGLAVGLAAVIAYPWRTWPAGSPEEREESREESREEAG